MLLFLLLITLDPSGMAFVEDGNLSYTTANLTFKEGPVWMVYTPSPAVVKLPERAAFVGGENITAVSVEGLRLTITFNSSGYAYYELNPQPFPWEWVVLLLFAALFLWAWRAGKLRPPIAKGEGGDRGPRRQPQQVERFLSEREARLYKAIERYPGICFKDLLNLLGWPKSTLSTTLKRLEAKGLVRAAKKGLSKCYYPTTD